MSDNIENNQSRITIADQQVMTMYEYEFSGEIESVEQHAELLELLSNASEHDLVRINNTSCGGNLDVTLRLASAISNAKCVTSCVIHGMVSSGGTLIALACEIVTAAPFSTFHIHSMSTGIGGKVSDINSYTTHVVEANKRLIEGAYGKFLTRAELDYVLSGGELYLTDEQTNAKLALVGKAADLSEAYDQDDETNKEVH